MKQQLIAMKLHNHFSHPKDFLLTNLIKSTAISDNVLLDAVKRLDENRTVCFKCEKPKLRPVVCFSLAQHLNEPVIK